MTFEACYEQWHRFVRKRVAALCPIIDDRQDIEQTVWLKAWLGWGRFKQDHIGGWLGTIAHHVCTDYWRTRKPAYSIEEYNPPWNPDLDPIDPALIAALRTLRPDQQRILALCILGYAPTEAAERLHMGAPTYRVYLHRARAAVKAAVA